MLSDGGRSLWRASGARVVDERVCRWPTHLFGGRAVAGARWTCSEGVSRSERVGRVRGYAFRFVSQQPPSLFLPPHQKFRNYLAMAGWLTSRTVSLRRRHYSLRASWIAHVIPKAISESPPKREDTSQVVLIQCSRYGTRAVISKYLIVIMFAQSGQFRQERDTFGELQVPADRYWGAQTQRCELRTGRTVKRL
jgi:hypothetical protein